MRIQTAFAEPKKKIGPATSSETQLLCSCCLYDEGWLQINIILKWFSVKSYYNVSFGIHVAFFGCPGFFRRSRMSLDTVTVVVAHMKQIPKKTIWSGPKNVVRKLTKRIRKSRRIYMNRSWYKYWASMLCLVRGLPSAFQHTERRAIASKTSAGAYRVPNMLRLFKVHNRSGISYDREGVTLMSTIAAQIMTETWAKINNARLQSISRLFRFQTTQSLSNTRKFPAPIEKMPRHTPRLNHT